MKKQAITEFSRILLTNHSIDKDKLNKALSDCYDKGVHFGNLKKNNDWDFHRLKEVKDFDLEKFILDITNSLVIKRINHIKRFVYSGPEITSNNILVCDFNIQKSLNYMSQKGSDYSYFNCYFRDRDWYNKSLNNTNDEEEIKYIQFSYHKKECEVLFKKIYQLGFSNGC